MAEVRRLRCTTEQLSEALSRSPLFNRAGRRLERRLKDAIPRKTGRTRDSVGFSISRISRGVRVFVRIAHKVGVFLTRGTKAHLVRRKDKRALTIPGPDGTILRTSARIPAIEPKVDLRRIERAERERLKREVATVAGRVLKDCFGRRR